MKHSPLRRTGRLTRSPIKPKSDKRRRQDRECNHFRQFHAEMAGSPCWLCGERVGTQAHHIAGRNHKLRHHRTNAFWTCERPCHMERLPRMDVVEVFEIKQRMDPEGYDRSIAALLLKGKNGRVA